jgi:hypothetical protein
VDPRKSAVARWFGAHFSELHPLLQSLHRHGGTLRGVVEIQSGTGVAGWLGRRLARSLGIPIDRRLRGFEVEIKHTETALEWWRRFDDGSVVVSHFEPVGAWPVGYWKETTGALQMHLTVDIVNGGWRWRPLRASLYGLRLPLRLLPKSRAGKHIECGKYRFEVEFSLPIVGRLLSYGGALEVASAA